MNPSILNTEVQEFINANLNSNSSKLAFKGSPFKDVNTKELIEQIEAKKRSKNKLPTWFKTPYIYYPNKLNIEQTSSEITANYKSNLISGKHLIDITGGFGVDSYYFSKHFKKITHCEVNKDLSKIVNHNYNQLATNKIETIDYDGLEYLKSSNKSFDWIYADPSRRHDIKGKVFFLKDCLPDIPKHLEDLFRCSKNIMIKTSPLLDISAGIYELSNVKEIHIIAIKNEVKELLWILERDYLKEVFIKTINIITNNKSQLFDFRLFKNNNTTINYSQVSSYLYEPNSSIMKSGGFKSLSEKFNLNKLHKHSHLFTSKELETSFPGRIFKIEKVIPYNKKLLKKEAIVKANITTRNFPESVQQIRKKFNIKDGGDLYLFFTTDVNNNLIVLLTKKA